MTGAGTTSTTFPAPPGPLDRRRPRLFLAIALAFVAFVGTLGASHRFAHDARALDVGAVLLLAVAPLVVAFSLRRRVTAVVVTVAALGAYVLAGYPSGRCSARPKGCSSRSSSAARRGRGGSPPGRVWERSRSSCRWRSRPATRRSRRPRRSSAGSRGRACCCCSRALRGRFDRLAERRARAREAADRREYDAVTAERLRIARELHDVLAHSLSAITVQAGVGLHLLDRDVEQARSALTQIRSTSRDALDEVRSVLGIVRADDGAPAGGPATPGTGSGGATVAAPTAGDTGNPAGAGPAPRAPSWTLDALPRLVDEFTVPGGPVATLDDALDPGLRAQVPPHVAGVVYRVVQEALTNARRHASGATRVDVQLEADPSSGGALVVRVSDDGPGPAAEGEAAPSSGYGLRGMRERVEAAGGVVRAGARDDARPGFEVEARVPLAPPDLSERGARIQEPGSDTHAHPTRVSERDIRIRAPRSDRPDAKGEGT
ncbi:sensor histidine kinase [Luteimicrobium album]|nr:sensor histidine kinase [Luteimicrobium album]